MEEELQQLKELVLQLKADNERLRREQAAAVPGSSAAPSTSSASSSASAPLAERLVFVPRDRKCPVFRGKSGIGLNEWLEEVQACMRARHLAACDQAFFLFDHLEGEAREEIKYRSRAEREDPDRIISILQDIYGCSDSYVALQEAFFSRRQQEGETLLEFSLALRSLMAAVEKAAPDNMHNAEVLVRDQFVEHVIDGALRRELKQFVRRWPAADLLEVRSEAIRWEREGLPGGLRGRSHSVPLVLGLQYGVRGGPQGVAGPPPASELSEMKEMLKRQQEQLNQLTQSLRQLQSAPQHSRPPNRGPVICRRCQQPGHFARECEGVRAAPRARPSLPAQPTRQFHGSQPSEN